MWPARIEIVIVLFWPYLHPQIFILKDALRWSFMINILLVLTSALVIWKTTPKPPNFLKLEKFDLFFNWGQMIRAECIWVAALMDLVMWCESRIIVEKPDSWFICYVSYFVSCKSLLWNEIIVLTLNDLCCGLFRHYGFLHLFGIACVSS